MTFAIVKHAGGNGEDRSGRRGPGSPQREVTTMRAESADQFRQREPTRLGEFIQRQLLGIQPGGKPVRLVLRHLEVGNRPGQRVGSDNIASLSEDEIGKMAIGIYDLAESDAIGLGNASQKYVLLSYDEENPSGDPSGRCIFEVQTGMRTDMQRAGGPEEDRYYDSNPPTEQGVLSQVMEQNKNLLNKVLDVVKANSGVAVALQAQVDRLMGRIAEEEQRRFDSFDMLEKARSDQWIREKEAKMLEADLESKREMIGLAKVAVPAILRRIGASDPKQRIEADDLQEINLALQFAQNEATFTKALDALPDEKAKVQFSEWVVFNVQRADQIEKERNARASGQPVPEQQRALPAPPPTPPTAEEIAKARAAQALEAKQQAEFWVARLQAVEAQRVAEEAAAAGKSQAAPQPSAGTEAPATPAAPAPKKNKPKAAAAPLPDALQPGAAEALTPEPKQE